MQERNEESTMKAAGVQGYLPSSLEVVVVARDVSISILAFR